VCRHQSACHLPVCVCVCRRTPVCCTLLHPPSPPPAGTAAQTAPVPAGCPLPLPRTPHAERTLPLHGDVMNWGSATAAQLRRDWQSHIMLCGELGAGRRLTIALLTKVVYFTVKYQRNTLLAAWSPGGLLGPCSSGEACIGA